MRYIFVDFEMNPIEKQYKEVKEKYRQEIIEIGAVMLDENYEEIESFKEYVKPKYSDEVTKKYEKLTGITTAMLSQAPSFEEAITRFLKWCRQGDTAYHIYAWSENDLMQLTKEAQLKAVPPCKELTYAINHWYDFQREFCDLLGLYKRISLETAISAIGREFTGQMHDALWDARNTAYIYKLSKNKDDFNKMMQPIIELINPPKEECTLGDLFDFGSLNFDVS